MAQPTRRTDNTIDVACSQCGKIKTIYRSAAHPKEHFCNRDCYKSWAPKHVSGANSQNWKGGEAIINCAQCYKAFSVERWRLKRGSKNNFCSINCFAKWKTVNVIGSKSNFWIDGGIETTCTYCDKSLKINVYRAKRSKMRFCDKWCYGKWKSKYRRGPNHQSWKGGLTSEDKRIRATHEYKEWRFMVFGRDDYTCQVCFERGVYLHAHHIRTFVDYPMLRFAIFNGITLCRGCHKKIRGHEEDYVEHFEDLIEKRASNEYINERIP